MVQINKQKFSLESAYQGNFFGVSPYYIAAVAQLRSGISNDKDDKGTGPFKLSESEWQTYRSAGDPPFDFLPSDISDWRLQVIVFAAMTKAALSDAKSKGIHSLDSVELYLGQILGFENLQKMLAQPEIAVANLFQDPVKAELAQRYPGLISGTAKQTFEDILARFNEAYLIVSPLVQQSVSDLMGDTHNLIGNTFDQKAPEVMKWLMRDFNLQPFQAAGILGNIGHESLGLTVMQEFKPVGGGMGGWGWCQWTGDRRKQFNAFCDQNNFAPDSVDANYGFLSYELNDSEKASLGLLKQTSSLEEATVVFEQAFERSGVKAHARRIEWARRAMKAFSIL